MSVLLDPPADRIPLPDAELEIVDRPVHARRVGEELIELGPAGELVTGIPGAPSMIARPDRHSEGSVLDDRYAADLPKQRGRCSFQRFNHKIYEDQLYKQAAS